MSRGNRRAGTSDRRVGGTTHYLTSRRPDNDSYLRRHCPIEDLREDDYMMGDRTTLLTRKTTEENLCQIPPYEQWNTPRNQGPPGNTNEIEMDDSKSESMGTLKRLQKIVRNKKASDDVRHALLQTPTQDIEEEEEETLITCMKLTKSQERKVTKEPVRKRQEAEQYTEQSCASLDRSFNLKWKPPKSTVPCPENSHFLMDWKSFPDHFDPFIFSPSHTEEWERCVCCNHQAKLSCSFTDTDLPYAWRTSSFGTFERFKKPSISKPEDLAEIGDTGSIFEAGGGGVSDGDKGGSLTKKMKAISLTMRRKMGKKYIKALSESEDVEGTFTYRDSDTTGGLATEKCTLKASESVESLYSLNSGQSSSSGVTSCSDGTSNRDSFRLDDDIPYTGPFCGRARVHTDFTPSPYDTDSLKIKKGDIIDIIYKTPMGIWTGMLNNKVGNFKFIYVDIISEEEVPRKIIRRKSKRPRPKTLQELLERFNLQEYMSSLLLNGYENLEDLKDIKESHLCELNITNPEERMRLLIAIANLQDCEPEAGNDLVPLTLGPDTAANKCELSDCPRDSGCYITLENSENSKDDVQSEKLCESVQKITISECP
ncbi:SAM domain-containing protein SAMSN-1 isoform X2 [Hyla sarda]|uniref:SAM domain-containing protein SAMSN-1 isoform X2 n=1 Tax=Hyla sarda TaxID=327740 RepID=UPI0024C3D096|nr:SAM domain-containing protein SAMSN-1 isoform X2 [Hyla sarda]